jgi:hypothetical protein
LGGGEKNLWWNLFFTGADPSPGKIPKIRACVHSINFGVTRYSGSRKLFTGGGTPQYIKKINLRNCLTNMKKKRKTSQKQRLPYIKNLMGVGHFIFYSIR